jgi:hypothetical protein
VTRRQESDRGASLVEAALVLPVFLLLLFGIIDLSGAYSDQHALRSGVRDAARKIAVGETDGDVTCPIVGAAPLATTRQAVCHVKALTGLPASDVRVAIRLEDPVYDVANSIKLCVQYPIQSLSGITGPVLEGADRVFESASEVQIERLVTPPIVEFTEPGHTTWNCESVGSSDGAKAPL